VRHVLAACAAALLATAAGAAAPDKADRKAFYDLVDRYQMFVVPHCEPEVINAYRAQNATRDAAFVQSLQGSKLADVYARAVADREKHDRKTVYDCQRTTPAPAVAPPQRTATQRRRAEREAARLVAAEAKRDRTEIFTEGDRIFAEMVALRDRTASASRN
jgi:hypothetical protein